LDQIYELAISKCAKDVKITLFGFSQGTATIMRWLHARKVKCHRVILWAGLTPEDISYENVLSLFPKKDTWLVYGTQDKFLTEERLAWQKQFATEQQLPFQYLSFDGKHKIERKPLLRFITS